MKILLVSFSHHPTLQNYIYILKRNMRSYSNEVYSLGNSKVLSLYETNDKSSFVECNDNASPSLSNIVLFFKESNQIKKIINNINPDIVLFTSKHIWNFFLIGYLKRKKINIFHVFHDPVGHSGTSVSKGVVFYNKTLSKHLTGIIVHSDISYQNTLKFIKPICPVVKVPLGEKEWLNYNKPYDYKHKLLIFGRISTYKGCEFIPQLAEELKRQSVNCKLLLAGKCLDDVSKELIDKINEYDNIIFHNSFISENDLDKYFYECDASLILHKSISQSGVIIDAYRHGHPIFCFNIKGISEFITNDTAFLIPPFDIKSLALKIKEMYADFDKYRQMSYSAYILGKTLFSEKDMGEQVYKFVTKRSM